MANTQVWIASHDVDVTVVLMWAGGCTTTHLGSWQWLSHSGRWDDPSGYWDFVPAALDADGRLLDAPLPLSDFDQRAIAAAKPTGSPVVRLDVKA